jgi:hypothetical protein
MMLVIQWSMGGESNMKGGGGQEGATGSQNPRISSYQIAMRCITVTPRWVASRPDPIHAILERENSTELDQKAEVDLQGKQGINDDVAKFFQSLKTSKVLLRFAHTRDAVSVTRRPSPPRNGW